MVAISLSTCHVLTLIRFWIAGYQSSGDYLVHHLISMFMHWDGMHFQHIASHSYQMEKNHAFLPGLPLLIRWYVSRAIRGPIAALGVDFVMCVVDPRLHFAGIQCLAGWGSC